MEEKKILMKILYIIIYIIVIMVLLNYLDCCYCSFGGKKIIMNNRNNFTFFYRGK